MANPIISVHQIRQSDSSGAQDNPLLKFFELLTASFTVPTVGASVGIVVEDSSRYSVGQYIYIPGAGYFEITALISTTGIYVRNMDSTGNYSPGTTVPAGSMFMACPPSIAVQDPVEYLQAGSVAVTTSNADDTLGVAVTFPVAFSVVPSAVVISVQSDVNIGALAGSFLIYARDITATGFKIYYTTDAVLAFNVKWIATL
jgi:hypothetical protein